MRFILIITIIFSFLNIEAQCDPNKNYVVDAGESVRKYVRYGSEGFELQLNGKAFGDDIVSEKWIVDGAEYPNNTEIELYQEGEYTATYQVTFTGGCEKKDSIDIFLSYPLEIPNAFSPNGDGVNERFVIRGMMDFPDAIVSIFDVAGLKLYDEFYSKGNAFDGTYNGSKLPPGNYSYIIKLNKAGWETPLVGTLTIIY